MYSILYSSGALKDIKSLPADIAKKLVSSIKGISDNPKTHVKKLKGFPKTPLYSLRVGDYRVIMSIEDEKMIIFVIEAGHRSKIYRKY
ncbi:type II toxin-antitoxin system RelE family toxin [Methanolobus profundi]|uniref:mRNA interferase RelE/StbE n=1 Tax=Methanolobus profundi TaxID=487685 RepID=A0A1I4UMF0_9EURY|nr:type II toxin-antitoxin system RelE/ParE family toxin [Methanolobus profundi]SFM90174.1 mRNA interferase RelE/StbE [Methanolobus profundi]